MNAIGIESSSVQTIQNERETSIIENKGNLQGKYGLIDDTEELPPNANGNSQTAAIDDTGVNFGTMGENVPNIINQTPQWPKAFPLGRRDSMSLASGRKKCNFANNMNQNMQNMLSPLLVLIQHGQEQAEEWDRIQQDQEMELRSQEAEREEEQQAEEAKMRAEEKACSERLNLVMLMVLAKIGSINKEDLQLDW
ncbi:hypothetical protein O181_049974 [Austropuccinia psidii MF-1]|uniref:Uncharacterized protein n=1 Tax=Austropuccinia psidii MF-1 TaxID=1389203 RepID=A0A9Q3DVV5_9BASI|nr:hypothetical protein [Austropuccinia psidii MF-1]